MNDEQFDKILEKSEILLESIGDVWCSKYKKSQNIEDLFELIELMKKEHFSGFSVENFIEINEFLKQNNDKYTIIGEKVKSLLDNLLNIQGEDEVIKFIKWWKDSPGVPGFCITNYSIDGEYREIYLENIAYRPQNLGKSNFIEDKLIEPFKQNNLNVINDLTYLIEKSANWKDNTISLIKDLFSLESETYWSDIYSKGDEIAPKKLGVLKLLDWENNSNKVYQWLLDNLCYSSSLPNSLEVVKFLMSNLIDMNYPDINNMILAFSETLEEKFNKNIIQFFEKDNFRNKLILYIDKSYEVTNSKIGDILAKSANVNNIEECEMIFKRINSVNNEELIFFIRQYRTYYPNKTIKLRVMLIDALEKKPDVSFIHKIPDWPFNNENKIIILSKLLYKLKPIILKREINTIINTISDPSFLKLLNSTFQGMKTQFRRKIHLKPLLIIKQLNSGDSIIINIMLEIIELFFTKSQISQNFSTILQSKEVKRFNKAKKLLRK